MKDKLATCKDIFKPGAAKTGRSQLSCLNLNLRASRTLCDYVTVTLQQNTQVCTCPNIEAYSFNYCSSRKALSKTYSDGVVL